MRGRRKPLHLIVDGLPAHKTRVVRDYVDARNGKLTLHFLPGSAPDLNPDEWAWSHAKRSGHARRPLRKGERLEERGPATIHSNGFRNTACRAVHQNHRWDRINRFLQTAL